MPRFKMPPPPMRRQLPDQRGSTVPPAPPDERDLNNSVPLPFDAAAISPHEREVARFRAEDARTGAQTDEVPPTVVMRRRMGLGSIPAIMRRRRLRTAKK